MALAKWASELWFASARHFRHCMGKRASAYVQPCTVIYYFQLVAHHEFNNYLLLIAKKNRTSLAYKTLFWFANIQTFPSKPDLIINHIVMCHLF